MGGGRSSLGGKTFLRELMIPLPGVGKGLGQANPILLAAAPCPLGEGLDLGWGLARLTWVVRLSRGFPASLGI